MTVAKNNIPLTESKLVRFSKKDMEFLKKAASEKRLSVASLIRMIVFDYFGKESKSK